MSTVGKAAGVVAIEEYKEETILKTDFTDGGGASGTYTCKFAIPAGFYIERCVLTDVTAFSGDTTAVVTIGDGSDVDRLNTGTPSVFASTDILNLGIPSGTPTVTTAFNPVITVTGGSDFGAVASTGALTIRVYGWKVRG